MKYVDNHVLVASDAAMVIIADNKRRLKVEIQLVVCVKKCFAALVELKDTFFHAIAVDTEDDIRTHPSTYFGYLL